MASKESELSLKLKVNNSDIRRIPLHHPFTYDRLKHLIEHLLDFKDPRILYKDDIGEQVRMERDEDLETAVLVMEESESKVLVLFVFLDECEGDSKCTVSERRQPVEAEPPGLSRFRPTLPTDPIQQSQEEYSRNFSVISNGVSSDDALLYFSKLHLVDPSEIVLLGTVLQSTALRLEQGESMSWRAFVHTIRTKCPTFAFLPYFNEDKAKLVTYLQIIANHYIELLEGGSFFPVPERFTDLMLEKSEKLLKIIFRMRELPTEVLQVVEIFKSFVRKAESVASNVGRVHQEQRIDPSAHIGFQCDGCGMNPIIGTRYHCRTCSDYDLCENCKVSGAHQSDHQMIKLETARGRGTGFGSILGRPANAVRGQHSCDASCAGTHTHQAFEGFGSIDEKCDSRSAPPPAGEFPNNVMRAQFIGHVNIEDKTVLRSGQYLKTWLLRNDGMDWDSSVRLVYVCGSSEVLVDGQDQFKVPLLRSNEVGDVSVPIVVPEIQGVYKTAFRLAMNGEQFGDYLLVEFEVD